MSRSNSLGVDANKIWWTQCKLRSFFMQVLYIQPVGRREAFIKLPLGFLRQCLQSRRPFAEIKLVFSVALALEVCQRPWAAFQTIRSCRRCWQQVKNDFDVRMPFHSSTFSTRQSNIGYAAPKSWEVKVHVALIGVDARLLDLPGCGCGIFTSRVPSRVLEIEELVSWIVSWKLGPQSLSTSAAFSQHKRDFQQQ